MNKESIELPFSLGTIVSDENTDYKLIEVLGIGTYSVVFLVKDLSTGILYALKCLSKYNLNEEMQQVQFDEVLAMQQLGNNKNIVKLYHHFETSDWLFLVLEYCEGSDLFSWILDVDVKTTSEQQRLIDAKPLFEQVLKAANYMHDCSVYHRDLKPENILLLKDGTVKIGDFGLAASDYISEEFYCGTKAYMSYECNHEENITYLADAADIWSLGLIFVNMIYRTLPWSEADADHCPKYAKFTADPINYLIAKLGCTYEIAEFLAEYVFCEESSRVSLKKFQNWFASLFEEDEKISINSTSDPISIALPALDFGSSSNSAPDSYLSEKYVPENIYLNKEMLEFQNDTKANVHFNNENYSANEEVFTMHDLYDALPNY